MATETTVKNIRATQDVFDRLKAMTDESFPNQGAALEALLNSWEVQTAKAAIPSRETDISEFDSHVQAIQRAFIRSLEMAENAEARARDSFRRQIESLEKEKAELRQALTSREEETKAAREAEKRANATTTEANKRAEAAERHAATLEKALEAEKRNAAAQIEDKEKLVHSLTAQVADASEQARANAADAAQAADLKKKLNAAKQELDAANAAAQIAAAKADAEKALAVSEARDSATSELLKTMTENSALKVEVERLKARITLLESPKAMNAAPMSDQQTPPAPTKDTSNAAQRRKATQKTSRSKPNTTPDAAKTSPTPESPKEE